MEYRVVRNTNDDELYHYGVKGMKWGVRRALGDKAKIAAGLERREKQYSKAATRHLNRQQKLQTKRLKLVKNGDESAIKMPDKEGREFDKYVAYQKYADKMKKYRNEVVKDLSEKDINQGRKYLNKAMLAGAIAVGPLGPGIANAREERRTSRYIREQNNKSNSKTTINKGAFTGVNKENYKYFEEMLKSQGSDIRKYKPTEIDEQGRIVRMTLR